MMAGDRFLASWISPPLIAPFKVGFGQFLPGMREGRLGAAGRVHVPADFDLQVLQRGAVSRLEEQIENLAALRLGVVDQQLRGRTCAQGADALKGPAKPVRVEVDILSANRGGQT